MPKQTIALKSIYWLKVVSLGLILGLGIQFAKAWTGPTAAPPGGNVSGPITTSGVAQTKDGALTVNAPLKSTKGGALNMGTLILGTTNLDGWSGKWLVLGDGSSGTEGWRNTNFQAGLVYAQALCIMNDCRVAWPAGGGGGVADNLGNHTATSDLNMKDNSIREIRGLYLTASPSVPAELRIQRLYDSSGSASFAGAGKVLTSDAQGYASWKTPSAGGSGNAVAWVSFDGQNGTILSSYNVSSVERVVTATACVGGSPGPCGRTTYTINFTQNMKDSNYATVVTATNNGYTGNQSVGLIPTSSGQAQTASSVKLLAYLGNNTGSMYPGTFPNVSVVIYSN